MKQAEAASMAAGGWEGAEAWAPPPFTRVPPLKQERPGMDTFKGVCNIRAECFLLVSGVGVWCLCLVSGVWCLVSGVWCLVLWCPVFLVSGVWCLVSGVWCLVSGVWCLVSCVWCLVSGVWCVVFGVWCLVFVFVVNRDSRLATRDLL